MDSIINLSVSEISDLISKKNLSVVEVNTAFLEQTNSLESSVKAWAFIDEDMVLEQAKRLDNTDWTGPLHGIPVGVKDVIEVAGMKTSFGSSVFADHVSSRDAMCIRDLRKSGAVIFGKTTTTEFATWTPSDTRNPLRLEHTPGGSSSGSAAAVSARMIPYALGTQTVGSTIRPASFCGIVGMKPSFGLLSTKGINLTSQRLDTLGLFSNSVEDMTLLFDSLLINRLGFTASSPQSLRLRISQSPWWDKADADARKALENAEAALQTIPGFIIEPYTFPDSFAGVPELQNTIAHFDIANNLKDLHEEHASQFSDNLGNRVVEGNSTSFNEYMSALTDANAAKDELLQDWDEDTFIVMPATTGVAPAGLDWTGDPTFCQPWSFIGCPVITVPTFRRAEDGLSVGVQLIGKVGTENQLLHAAAQLHAALK